MFEDKIDNVAGAKLFTDREKSKQRDRLEKKPACAKSEQAGKCLIRIESWRGREQDNPGEENTDKSYSRVIGNNMLLPAIDRALPYRDRFFSNAAVVAQIPCSDRRAQDVPTLVFINPRVATGATIGVGLNAGPVCATVPIASAIIATLRH